MSSRLTSLLKPQKNERLIRILREYVFKTQEYIYRTGDDREVKRHLAYCQKHFSGVLRQHAEGTTRQHHVGKFHPSSLFGCKRAIWFDITGAKGNPPVTATDALKSHLIFAMGDSIHLMIQSLCDGAGILVQAEIPLEDTELNLEGHCDGVIRLDGRKEVLEIKSCNAGTFASLQGPKEQHVAQTMIYMDQLSVEDGIILYVNKDRSELKEFSVKLDKAKVKEYRDAIAMVTLHQIACTVPSRDGDSPSCDTCRWCGYTRECWDSEKLQKHVETLKESKHENKGKASVRTAGRQLRIGNKVVRIASSEKTGAGSSLKRFLAGRG